MVPYLKYALVARTCCLSLFFSLEGTRKPHPSPTPEWVHVPITPKFGQTTVLWLYGVDVSSARKTLFKTVWIGPTVTPCQLGGDHAPPYSFELPSSFSCVHLFEVPFFISFSGRKLYVYIYIWRFMCSSRVTPWTFNVFFLRFVLFCFSLLGSPLSSNKVWKHVDHERIYDDWCCDAAVPRCLPSRKV